MKTNEQILVASAFVLVVLALVGMLCVIYLRLTNFIMSDTDAVFYVIPVTLGCLVFFFAIYEVLYGYKIQRKPAYQFKRFLIRSSIFASFLSFVLAVWYALQFYLLPFLYWKYSLLMSFFVATMLLVIIVVKIPKIRDTLVKLEKGV